MKVFFFTPPFTQLNTPYPATAYLKGYLNSIGVDSSQADLGLEVILNLFTKKNLAKIFQIASIESTTPGWVKKMYVLKNSYLNTIESVIQFLQNKNPTMAHTICAGNFLPLVKRNASLEDLEFSFGEMGIQDKAKHLCTLYLEDIGDFITEVVDPHFGFSRYAERLARSASDFDELYLEIKNFHSLISDVTFELLSNYIEKYKPNIVCVSVPFPGNLFSALQCGHFLKRNYPNIKFVLGGGYANTELRSIKEKRVFEFVDFICLDDGEMPLKKIIEFCKGEVSIDELQRTYTIHNGELCYMNHGKEKDVPMKDSGTPDYKGLFLQDYISVIEVTNSMHRMWSDGRWNKLTLAHGCYWGKCSFCDTTLDYIKRYEPQTASLICDKIEQMIRETGQNGFHFVDEAAPPNLLRELSLEILRRNLVVSWWTNIRFEKLFTPDLSRLMRKAGCIAVAGGLEVASDRLLERMKKGVTVAQVSQVAKGFTDAGIMVHAYLMYGFPTQTEQETIDSMEMVRQMFTNGVLQSGFWHRFAMTAHSPVGINPLHFKVNDVTPTFKGFADNDRFHEDLVGANHDLFAEGLRLSLYNYMRGAGYDLPLQHWFKHLVPSTIVHPNYIESCLAEGLRLIKKQKAFLIWIGGEPELILYTVNKKGKEIKKSKIVILGLEHTESIKMDQDEGKWIFEILNRIRINDSGPLLLSDFELEFEKRFNKPASEFLMTENWYELKAAGLLVL